MTYRFRCADCGREITTQEFFYMLRNGKRDYICKTCAIGYAMDPFTHHGIRLCILTKEGLVG